MPFDSFYKGKRVLVTGDTGFKGSWLVCWLNFLEAEVHGIGLSPHTDPSLFSILRLKERMQHVMLDLRDVEEVKNYIRDLQPDVVFHLAAQSLVRLSYRIPLETLHTNFLGTANLLYAIGEAGYSDRKPCTLVMITSDKCYENRNTYYAYREDDRMGGDDLYSASKGASELLISAWRRSFFDVPHDLHPPIRMASCRAGNVIGGGDWAEDRIVPDSIKSLIRDEPIKIRNPESIRPWQHVLEPLSGYLQLGAALGRGQFTKGERCYAWNFGPGRESEKTVGELCDAIVSFWGAGSWEHSPERKAPHEARYLKLAIDKAWYFLGWQPVWNFEQAVEQTVSWYRLAHESDYSRETMLNKTLEQTEQYMNDAELKALQWMKST